MKAEEVGYRIAQARKKQGMTQRELSERLHVSDKAVSKWERGVNYPDISLFDEIAKTLDLSLVELLGIKTSQSSKSGLLYKRIIDKGVYQQNLFGWHTPLFFHFTKITGFIFSSTQNYLHILNFRNYYA